MSNRLKFGKQMDASKEKDTIAEIVESNNRKNVLDLGAGTCKISKQIADKGIHVTAVDFHLDDYDIEKSDLVNYVNSDLVEFVKTTQEKFDCLVLSGILHELSEREMEELSNNLGKILTEDVLILIREPAYDYVDKKYYAPFKSGSAMEKCSKLILENTPQDFQEKFKTTTKLHNIKLPRPIYLLNMAFTFSYGPESWERELKEYRFTYSLQEIKTFIASIFKSFRFNMETKMIFDESYRKYFKQCGYPDGVLDSVNYTNTSIIIVNK